MGKELAMVENNDRQKLNATKLRLSRQAPFDFPA